MEAHSSVRTARLYHRIRDRLRWELREWRAPSRPSFVQDELDAALFDEISWREGERVLDVGCAHGSYMRRLIDRRVDVVGIDLDRTALARAANQCCRVLAASGDRLPFADASFDTVLSHKTMHLFPQPETVVAEFRRVLRPGGRVVFSTSNLASPYARVQAAALRMGRNPNWGKNNRLGVNEWSQLFCDAGMKTAAVYSCNLVWPLVYRVCDRWIVPNEWMRRYTRWVRRTTRMPMQTSRPLGAAMDYIVEIKKQSSSIDNFARREALPVHGIANAITS